MTTQSEREAVAIRFLAIWYGWGDDPLPWWEAVDEDRRAIGLKAADAIIALRSPEGGEVGRLREALKTMLRYRQTVRDCLGECMHAGLRKGSQAPSSASLWRAISDSRDSAWSDAVQFALDGFEYGSEKAIAAAEALAVAPLGGRKDNNITSLDGLPAHPSDEGATAAPSVAGKEG